MTKKQQKQLRISHRNSLRINYFFILILLLLPLITAPTNVVYKDSFSNSLQAYWHFDETTGNVYNDSFGINNLILGANNHNASGLLNYCYTTNNTYWYNTNVSSNGTGTVNFWGNVITASAGIPFSNFDTTLAGADGSIAMVVQAVTEKFRVIAYDSVGLKATGYVDKFPNLNWTMFTVMWNSTTLSLYLNGTLNQTVALSGFTGLNNNFTIFAGQDSPPTEKLKGYNIDEFTIWNRTLTPSEISNLYNNGTGIYLSSTVTTYNCYQETANVSTSCGGLSTGYYDISGDNVFPITLPTLALYDGDWDTYSRVNPTSVGWFNITYMKPISSLGAKWQIKGLNDTMTYATNVTIPDDCFNYGNNLSLKVVSNGTGTYGSYWYCNNGTSLRLLKVIGVNEPHIYEEGIFWNLQDYFEGKPTYNNLTIENSVETFSLPLVYDTSIYANILSYFIYNGTSYTTTITRSEGVASINSTITVPTVSTTLNETFYWSIILINQTGSYTYFNSTKYNQTVLNLAIDDCTSYSNLILNYSLKDELTQLLINGSLYNSTIEVNISLYDLDLNKVILTFNKTYNKTNNAKVCFNLGLFNYTKYSIYVDTSYKADSYVQRHNYLQNFIIQNSTIPQNINLFDLLSTYATKFYMSYSDFSLLNVEDALITINRQYLGEGVFKTVEIEKTNNYGEATAWFDTTGTFQIIVSKNGVVLAIFNNVLVFCTNALSGDCKISLDASSTFIPADDFTTISGLNYYQTFNQTSLIYSLIFSTQDNSVADILINITQFNMYGNTTLCTNSVTTNAGTLTCDLSAYSNLSFVADVYSNGKLISSSIFTINPYAQSNPYRGNLILLSMGIIISIGVMFIPSAVGVIIGSIIAFVTVFIMFLLTGDGRFGWALVIPFLVACVIVIWRLRQGGND